MEIYDLVIIGAGPAGLTAAVYAGRYLLNTLVIGEIQGGTISEAVEVCNFPSYESIRGMELTKKLINQTEKLGIDIKQEKVEEIRKNKDFEIKTNKSVYKSKKVILATGRKKRKLDIEGEAKFLGKGVSYCATCDAAFFRDKIVAVAGGSNAALTAALLLTEYSKKVYIIYRKEFFFRAEPAWVKQVENNKKIETIFKSNINEIKGSKNVEKIILDSGKELSVDGVFIEVGSIPDTKLPRQLDIELDNNDYVIANELQKTSLSGVFAAGDITNNSLKQAVTAAAEGAIAANSAFEEIRKKEIEK